MIYDENSSKVSWAHGVLPEDARALLVKASETPGGPGNRLAKSKAIDAAMERIRAKYPRLFVELPEVAE
jgi:hypothetical protein